MQKLTLIVIDQNQERRALISGKYSRSATVHECSNPNELLKVLNKHSTAIILIGSMAGGSAESIHSAHQVSDSYPLTKVVLLADDSSEAVAIAALRAGVAEYVRPPITGSKIWEAIEGLRSSGGNDTCDDRTTELFLEGPDELIGRCHDFLKAKEIIRRVATVDMTVLITGETGTGKELAARAIHNLSPRRHQPFVCVNCAAIPDTLLESELFGFERGAFTGANMKQVGKLRSAHRGTIFLDEIGDMPLAMQAKMLRVLESREIQPLGSSASVQVDVRVVAATHQNLELMMGEQRFRSDLFFRLNVLPVHLPPLRQRPEDIPELVDHFIRELNSRYDRDIVGVSRAGLRLLQEHEWPGNIRQLRNVIEGAFLVCSSDWVSVDDLRYLHWSPAKVSPISTRVNSPQFPRLPAVPEPDRLREALNATLWNKTKAAELLHWSRMTLYRKIAKYQLNQEGRSSEAPEIGTPVTSY